MAEQVAEQPLRHGLGALVARPLRAGRRVAPRAAYSSGMIQAWAPTTNATGAVIGSSQSMPAAAATNGTV